MTAPSIKSPLRIGTRHSPLALIQTALVRQKIEAAFPSLAVEVVSLSTTGDREQTLPLREIGGKGLFLKELEQALLREEIDLAVHSLKDAPAIMPPGLVIESVGERASPFDALISDTATRLDRLPIGARVGTSSLRRSAQLRVAYPELTFHLARGNVQTRLRKLDRGEFDALVLAESGLRRLALDERIAEVIPPEICIPAGGQGALGIETRLADQALRDALLCLRHEPTDIICRCEREFLRRLEGNCHQAIGVYARISEDRLSVMGYFAPETFENPFIGARTGPVAFPEKLGFDLAEECLAHGAQSLEKTT